MSKQTESIDPDRTSVGPADAPSSMGDEDDIDLYGDIMNMATVGASNVNKGDLDLYGDILNTDPNGATNDNKGQDGSELSDMDLYDDILAEDQHRQDLSYKELCTKFHDAMGTIKQLEQEKSELENRKVTVNQLETNMSSLIKTARAELLRKESEISRLRQQLQGTRNFSPKSTRSARDGSQPYGQRYRNTTRETTQEQDTYISSDKDSTISDVSTSRKAPARQIKNRVVTGSPHVSISTSEQDTDTVDCNTTVEKSYSIDSEFEPMLFSSPADTNSKNIREKGTTRTTRIDDCNKTSDRSCSKAEPKYELRSRNSTYESIPDKERLVYANSGKHSDRHKYKLDKLSSQQESAQYSDSGNRIRETAYRRSEQSYEEDKLKLKTSQRRQDSGVNEKPERCNEKLRHEEKNVSPSCRTRIVLSDKNSLENSVDKSKDKNKLCLSQTSTGTRNYERQSTLPDQPNSEKFSRNISNIVVDKMKSIDINDKPKVIDLREKLRQKRLKAQSDNIIQTTRTSTSSHSNPVSTNRNLNKRDTDVVSATVINKNMTNNRAGLCKTRSRTLVKYNDSDILFGDRSECANSCNIDSDLSESLNKAMKHSSDKSLRCSRTSCAREISNTMSIGCKDRNGARPFQNENEVSNASTTSIECELGAATNNLLNNNVGHDDNTSMCWKESDPDVFDSEIFNTDSHTVQENTPIVIADQDKCVNAGKDRLTHESVSLLHSQTAFEPAVNTMHDIDMKIKLVRKKKSYDSDVTVAVPDTDEQKQLHCASKNCGETLQSDEANNTKTTAEYNASSTSTGEIGKADDIASAPTEYEQGIQESSDKAKSPELCPNIVVNSNLEFEAKSSKSNINSADTSPVTDWDDPESSPSESLSPVSTVKASDRFEDVNDVSASDSNTKILPSGSVDASASSLTVQLSNSDLLLDGIPSNSSLVSITKSSSTVSSVNEKPSLTSTEQSTSDCTVYRGVTSETVSSISYGDDSSNSESDKDEESMVKTNIENHNTSKDFGKRKHKKYLNTANNKSLQTSSLESKGSFSSNILSEQTSSLDTSMLTDSSFSYSDDSECDSTDDENYSSSVTQSSDDHATSNTDTYSSSFTEDSESNSDVDTDYDESLPEKKVEDNVANIAEAEVYNQINIDAGEKIVTDSNFEMAHTAIDNCSKMAVRRDVESKDDASCIDPIDNTINSVSCSDKSGMKEVQAVPECRHLGKSTVIESDKICPIQIPQDNNDKRCNSSEVLCETEVEEVTPNTLHKNSKHIVNEMRNGDTAMSLIDNLNMSSFDKEQEESRHNSDYTSLNNNKTEFVSDDSGIGSVQANRSNVLQRLLGVISTVVETKANDENDSISDNRTEELGFKNDPNKGTILGKTKTITKIEETTDYNQTCNAGKVSSHLSNAERNQGIKEFRNTVHTRHSNCDINEDMSDSPMLLDNPEQQNQELSNDLENSQAPQIPSVCNAVPDINSSFNSYLSEQEEHPFEDEDINLTDISTDGERLKNISGHYIVEDEKPLFFTGPTIADAVVCETVDTAKNIIRQKKGSSPTIRKSPSHTEVSTHSVDNVIAMNQKVNESGGNFKPAVSNVKLDNGEKESNGVNSPAKVFIVYNAAVSTSTSTQNVVDVTSPIKAKIKNNSQQGNTIILSPVKLLVIPNPTSRKFTSQIHELSAKSPAKVDNNEHKPKSANISRTKAQTFQSATETLRTVSTSISDVYKQYDKDTTQGSSNNDFNDKNDDNTKTTNISIMQNKEETVNAVASILSTINDMDVTYDSSDNNTKEENTVSPSPDILPCTRRDLETVEHVECDKHITKSKQNTCVSVTRSDKTDCDVTSDDDRLQQKLPMTDANFKSDSRQHHPRNSESKLLEAKIHIEPNVKNISPGISDSTIVSQTLGTQYKGESHENSITAKPDAKDLSEDINKPNSTTVDSEKAVGIKASSGRIPHTTTVENTAENSEIFQTSTVNLRKYGTDIPCGSNDRLIAKETSKIKTQASVRSCPRKKITNVNHEIEGQKVSSSTKFSNEKNVNGSIVTKSFCEHLADNAKVISVRKSPSKNTGHQKDCQNNKSAIIKTKCKHISTKLPETNKKDLVNAEKLSKGHSFLNQTNAVEKRSGYGKTNSSDLKNKKKTSDIIESNKSNDSCGHHIGTRTNEHIKNSGETRKKTKYANTNVAEMKEHTKAKDSKTKANISDLNKLKKAAQQQELYKLILNKSPAKSTRSQTKLTVESINKDNTTKSKTNNVSETFHRVKSLKFDKETKSSYKSSDHDKTKFKAVGNGRKVPSVSCPVSVNKENSKIERKTEFATIDFDNPEKTDTAHKKSNNFENQIENYEEHILNSRKKRKRSTNAISKVTTNNDKKELQVLDKHKQHKCPKDKYIDDLVKVDSTDINNISDVGTHERRNKESTYASEFKVVQPITDKSDENTECYEFSTSTDEEQILRTIYEESYSDSGKHRSSNVPCTLSSGSSEISSRELVLSVDSSVKTFEPRKFGTPDIEKGLCTRNITDTNEPYNSKKTSKPPPTEFLNICQETAKGFINDEQGLHHGNSDTVYDGTDCDSGWQVLHKDTVNHTQHAKHIKRRSSDKTSISNHQGSTSVKKQKHNTAKNDVNFVFHVEDTLDGIDYMDNLAVNENLYEQEYEQCDNLNSTGDNAPGHDHLSKYSVSNKSLEEGELSDSDADSGVCQIQAVDEDNNTITGEKHSTSGNPSSGSKKIRSPVTFPDTKTNEVALNDLTVNRNNTTDHHHVNISSKKDNLKYCNSDSDYTPSKDRRRRSRSSSISRNKRRDTRYSPKRRERSRSSSLSPKHCKNKTNLPRNKHLSKSRSKSPVFKQRQKSKSISRSPKRGKYSTKRTSIKMQARSKSKSPCIRRPQSRSRSRSPKHSKCNVKTPSVTNHRRSNSKSPCTSRQRPGYTSKTPDTRLASSQRLSKRKFKDRVDTPIADSPRTDRHRRSARSKSPRYRGRQRSKSKSPLRHRGHGSTMNVSSRSRRSRSSSPLKCERHRTSVSPPSRGTHRSRSPRGKVRSRRPMTPTSRAHESSTYHRRKYAQVTDERCSCVQKHELCDRDLRVSLNKHVHQTSMINQDSGSSSDEGEGRYLKHASEKQPVRVNKHKHMCDHTVSRIHKTRKRRYSTSDDDRLRSCSPECLSHRAKRRRSGSKCVHHRRSSNSGHISESEDIHVKCEKHSNCARNSGTTDCCPPRESKTCRSRHQSGTSCYSENENITPPKSRGQRTRVSDSHR